MVRASTQRSSTPCFEAAARVPERAPSERVVGIESTATWSVSDATCARSRRHSEAISASDGTRSPVTLALRPARPTREPSRAGSTPATKTIGMAAVTLVAAHADDAPAATMTSTPRATSSAARSRRRSRRPSAHRHSTSTADVLTVHPMGSTSPRTPMRGTRCAWAGCTCAASGPASAARTMPWTNPRRSITGWPSRSSAGLRARASAPPPGRARP